MAHADGGTAVAHQDLADMTGGQDITPSSPPPDSTLKGSEVEGASGHQTDGRVREQLATPDRTGGQARRKAGRGRGILLGVGLGLAMALVGGRLANRPSDTAQAEPSAPTASQPSQTVTVAPVEAGPIPQTVTAGGTVGARELLPVKAEAAGLPVKNILVREGEFVEAGQVLAILGDTVITAQVQEAQARLEAAQAAIQQEQAQLTQAQAEAAEAAKNFARYQVLADQGAVSQQELDARATTAFTARERIGVGEADIQAAQANLRSRVAELERLQAQLGQTQVKAPAAGVIAQTSQQPIANVGDITANAQPLFLIIQNDQLELLVAAHQSYLPLIQPGIPVLVTSDSDPRVQLQGQVREIGEIVNPDTRLATVRIDLPPSDLIQTGMYLQATAIAGAAPGLTVPANAVVQKSDQPIVYRLGQDNQVEAVPIELGTQLPASGGDPARVQVLSGLSASDRVVVSGAGFLEDGDFVEVADPLL